MKYKVGVFFCTKNCFLCMASLACLNEAKQKTPKETYESIPLCLWHHAHSSEAHLRGFKFPSPPVGINPVLSNVGAFPWTVYEAWFYYFPPLDM